MTLHVPALIVGAGISGLVCAHALRKAGVDALVVEACARPGGSIHSERRDGYLLELGPQSFSGTGSLLALCAELGIEGELVKASPHAPRYVLIGGLLNQVPLSPPAFLASDLVSARTKWAIARDVFGKSHTPEQDESVAAFVRRKFSAELLDRLVGPFVSGVYAGDPERLSLRSSFPMLYDAEKRKGSVIRGMMARSGKEPRQRPTLLSFRDGTEALTRALSARLGDALRLNARVTRIRSTGTPVYTEPRSAPAGVNTTSHEPIRNIAGASFQVTLQAQKEETILADDVVIATPTDAAANLLRELTPSFESLLGAVEYAAVAVVSLGYRRSDVGHPLTGFGFLVPRSAGLRVLGTVWNSSLFPGRAPDGHVLLTSFVGGATDPAAMSLQSAELAALVHREIAPLLAINQKPAFSNVTMYPRALPQYNLGHAERLAAIETQRANFPNLWLTGNYLSGPSVGACVQQSLKVTNQILSRMRS
ncbi:MAG: protoporphyrinogen oxidase [Candidatus Acidiferrum sp.]